MVSPKHIGDYYHLGGLFVSSSVSETQGLTYVEALASGLSVLCRKDESLNGVVFNGINGWLYESEQDFLDKLDLFFNSSEMQKSMAEDAARLARQMYFSAAFANKVEDVYFLTFYNCQKVSLTKIKGAKTIWFANLILERSLSDYLHSYTVGFRIHEKTSQYMRDFYLSIVNPLLTFYRLQSKNHINICRRFW